MALVADSGGIYGLYDSRDRHHAAIREVVNRKAQAIHIPAPLLGELGYMLFEWLGSGALVQFLADVEGGAFQVEPFLMEDVHRCRELLATYADLNLGLCDAAVVSTAERLGIDQILSVDERHFRTIRPASGKPFILLPADRH